MIFDLSWAHSPRSEKRGRSAGGHLNHTDMATARRGSPFSALAFPGSGPGNFMPARDERGEQLR